MQACPKNCISMQADNEGFLYPSVDSEKCADCGACERVCPMLSSADSDVCFDEPRAFAAYHRDRDILMSSSSGGAFSAVATWIIADGGIVCACRLNDELKAVHDFAGSVEELAPFRGSKYVQSDTGLSYSKVKEYLELGRKVLFVGTPCQCAGLRTFLGKVPPDLITCDFICHGVPSPKVFAEYIKSFEEKLGEKITQFRFRTKDRAWVQSGMQQGTVATTESGKVIGKHPAYRDEFMNGFLSDIMLRPSCYECSFKTLPKSYSDITIADFWGIGKALPEMNNPEGTSLVLINSSKGMRLFDKVESDIKYNEVPYKKAIKGNRSIIRSSPLNSMRYYFFKELEEKGYSYVSRKYLTVFKWVISTAIKKGWGMIESIIRSVLGPIVKKVDPNWNEKRWESLMQFFKFSLVGVSNSLVSYAVNVTTLLLLRPLGFDYDYIIANITAFLLAVMWSYNLNSKHVFKVKVGEERSEGKTLLKTYVSYAFSGIVLNNVLGTLWIKYLGISRFIAPMINLLITVPVNFVLNKYWAYGRKDEA